MWVEVPDRYIRDVVTTGKGKTAKTVYHLHPKGMAWAVKELAKAIMAAHSNDL